MLSAPPLLPHRPQLAASSSSASSGRAADASQAMANEENGITTNTNTNDSNVFASLMPNVFSRLQHCDDTVSEQEFQDFHRLLNLARSEDDLIKGNSFMNQPLVGFLKQGEKGDEIAREEVRNKPSPLTKSDYGGGKENALPTNPSQRNKFSRRERSSRITTRRKPFVVDVRSFGSLLNNNALGKFKKPQDVLAFWEAADEREASEAIMCKLKGRSEQKTVNGNSILRRPGVRRKNSQRETIRLKRFAVELPSCAEQVQSLDQEQLEEEEDAPEESSFTFLSNPLFVQSNAEKQINAPQLVSPVQAVENDVKMVYLDGSAKLQAEDDHDILSDGKSPLVISTGAGQCSFGLIDNIAPMDGSDECEKQSQVPEIVDITQSDQAVQPISSLAADSQDRNLSKDIDAANELELKVTPYNRNIGTKRTPFTSPTPPSNPLAAFELRKDNAVEDMSKRRLYFDDTMDSPTLEQHSPAPIMENIPCLQDSCDTMDSPTLELHSPAPILENTPCFQDSLASPKVPKTVVEKKNLEVAEEIKSMTSDLLPTEAMKSPEQDVTKPSKKATAKRRPLNDRRNSLEGAGTNWKEGQRRSTRIRSRPLEWWRGERFLRGRVHKSLPTVIGIKYSSPPPCWPKRGTKPPKFKVESYVAKEYARYVQLAASY